MKDSQQVKQTVPFFTVSDMERSMKFYVDGLGFHISNRWIVDDKLRWCWLQLGGAALMLQEIDERGAKAPMLQQAKGVGVSIYFICEDAITIYHEITSRGIDAVKPFVGNSMWVTGLTDPDGFHIYFESYTDTPEGTDY